MPNAKQNAAIIASSTTPFDRSLLLFSAVAGSLFGYSTGAVSGSLVAIRNEFALSTSAQEWFVSITTLTSAVVSLLGAVLAEHFGRRPVLLASGILCIAGSAAISFAQSLAALLVGRALIGAAVGLVSMTAPMYASELAPPATRGFIVALNDFSIVAAQLVAGLVNVGFQDFASNSGWRWAMGLSALPAILLLLALVPLPESPRWLYLRGQIADARASLDARRGADAIASDPLAADEAQRDFERMSTALDEESRSSSHASNGGWLSMLGALWSEPPLRRAALLGLLLMALNQLSGINTIMYYSSTIFERSHGYRVALWLAAAANLAQLLGVLIALYTIDRQGRRLTALRSCALVAVTLAALAISYALSATTLSVVLIMLYLLAFGSGLSGACWVVTAEIYPMRVRAAAVALATFTNWIFNFVVSQSFLSLADAITYSGSFGVYGGVALIGGLLLYRYLPETSGVHLEAIERLFADPYPANVGREGAWSGEATALLQTLTVGGVEKKT